MVFAVYQSSKAASGKSLLLTMLVHAWHRLLLPSMIRICLCQESLITMSKSTFPLAASLLLHTTSTVVHCKLCKYVNALQGNVEATRPTWSETVQNLCTGCTLAVHCLVSSVQVFALQCNASTTCVQKQQVFLLQTRMICHPLVS